MATGEAQGMMAVARGLQDLAKQMEKMAITQEQTRNEMTALSVKVTNHEQMLQQLALAPPQHSMGASSPSGGDKRQRTADDFSLGPHSVLAGDEGKEVATKEDVMKMMKTAIDTVIAPVVSQAFQRSTTASPQWRTRCASSS